MATFKGMFFMIVTNGVFVFLVTRLYLIVKNREIQVKYALYSLSETPIAYLVVLINLVIGVIMTGFLAVMSIFMLVSGTWEEPAENRAQHEFQDRRPSVTLVEPSSR